MRVIDFIVAEDIRQELGNKYSIMGIFNDRLLVATSNWPMPFRLAIYMRFALEPGDAAPDRVVLGITFKNAPLANIEAQVAFSDVSGLIALPFVASQFPLPGPGKLNFSVSVHSGGEQIFSSDSAFSMEVQQRPDVPAANSAGALPAQPS